MYENGDRCVKQEDCDADDEKSTKDTGVESTQKEDKPGPRPTRKPRREGTEQPSRAVCEALGKEFRICGSACPPTCENPQRFCIQPCVAGTATTEQ